MAPKMSRPSSSSKGIKKDDDLPKRPHPAEEQRPSKIRFNFAKLAYASDCSGMDVAAMALKKLFNKKNGPSFVHLFASEIDPVTRSVLVATHPECQAVYEDATKHDLANLVKQKNKHRDHLFVYTSGFPCQPFSMQGKRKGPADARGQVIYHELALVDELKPDLVLFENVSTLATDAKYRTFFKEVLHMASSLANNAYYVDWKVMDTYKYTGLPASRPRVYIVLVKKNRLMKTWNWPNEVPPMDLDKILDHDLPKTNMKDLSNTNLKNLADGLEKVRSQGRSMKSPCVIDLAGGKNFGVNVQFNKYPTITRSHANALWLSHLQRFATPKEVLRAQGIKLGSDVKRPHAVSEKKLSEMAGNSFTLPMMERMFSALLPAMGFAWK